MSEYPLIADLALILIAAGFTSVVCKLTKLPVIVGYLLAGVLTGPYISILPNVTDKASISTWSEIGVIFLLFALGLEFNFKSLLKVGKTGAITALAILFGVMVASFGLGGIFSWNATQSIFMGGMLAISSTMIAVKAFEELKLKGQPFTHVVYGVEVVEDIVAILLLVVLPMLALSQGDSLALEVSTSLMRVVFFMSLWFIGGIFLVPTILRKLKKHLNDELLLIISLALCLSMVMLAEGAGLSSALGAFVIGSILGTTTEAHRIETLMAPLKNLFGAIFFVSVGMLADPAVFLEVQNLVIISLALLVVVIVQPIMAMLGVFASGKTLSESVHAGLSFGNIGEFSFIIANLGIAQGVLEDNLYPVIIAVCVITTISMPNMLKRADKLTAFLEKKLPESVVRRGEAVESPLVKKAPNRRAILIKQFLFESFILGVVSIGIIALVGGFVAPKLDGFIDQLDYESITVSRENVKLIAGGACLGVMLLCMLPFLSALVVRRSNMQHTFFVALLKGGSRGLIQLLAVLRLLLIALLIAFAVVVYSPFDLPINVAIGIVVFILALSFKGLFANYIRIEKQFLFNYNEVELAEQKDEQDGGEDRSHESLPSMTCIREGDWLSDDLSVAHVRIDEDSPFIDETLKSLNLRAKHGLFIIRIEHGNDYSDNIPAGDAKISLDDTICIVGKIEDFKALTRAPYNLSMKKLHIESMRSFIRNSDERRTDEANLRCVPIPIREKSGLAYKTLRESGIGERTKCLVIGIEVNGRVEMSPKADTIFEPGNLIWVVGEYASISTLIAENLAKPASKPEGETEAAEVA
ncbi:MAG: cation:proton antiporter [Proteobacteria bacterium]|nr:cation:proton antiporter [Pseudomonadota bacterium]